MFVIPKKQAKKAILRIGQHLEYAGESICFPISISGEVVFTTGMVGYPESLTDPSYHGQILVCSYPQIGNYGVPDKKFWESISIKASGVIVQRANHDSHPSSKIDFCNWLIQQKVPCMELADTRHLIIKLREEGTMIGHLHIGNKPTMSISPDISAVSTKQICRYGDGDKKVVLIDCGVKESIITNLVERKTQLIQIPWNYPIQKITENYQGVIISNGPGDPRDAAATIESITHCLKIKMPILGICLGHQLLALAAGGQTEKMKYGHRSQNQPVRQYKSNRAFLTTQNHGYHVTQLPKNFYPWFINCNDQTNEGIHHNSLPIMSVQYHPEASPGPNDTNWIFNYFLSKI